MNNRQHKKKFKKLRKAVFGDYDEIKGRKITKIRCTIE